MTGRRDIDWITLLATLILCVVGISMIYSVFQPPINGGDFVERDLVCVDAAWDSIAWQGPWPH